MRKELISKKGIVIGEGKPKICVPITGKSLEQIKQQVEKIACEDVEMVEWRVDFYNEWQEEQKIVDVLEFLQTKLYNKLILFTFRSKREGGEQDISKEKYISLCKSAIQCGFCDLIDVELFFGVNVVQELVDCAHKHDIFVIMSNHDFDKTPQEDEIEKRLLMMQEQGADILKIAVMPNSSQDVLSLLSVTNKMNNELAKKPVVTMSMSRLGVVSRLSGEIFGSAITFATIGEASAPGQIPVSTMKMILNLFH